ncbi:hypothetical protein RclHR1_03560010 [Rhizophagus clarus]|uniref:F-box domain-containing protein n=1 Tax=Rhizophagus clarus TaxID=94130 RepID=A0A2Z6RAY4_9GLOM|nr:hypothetical protein RclHR1_03560010 [Rhizophagus clarus]
MISHIDCLNIVIEYLEEDKVTLHSWLLVNRLWCRISVKILWRNIWKFKRINFTQVIGTLITCLPNESKDFLINNGVSLIPTSKPPLFNYASFFKVLKISSLLISDYSLYNSTKNLENHLIIQEILKMFMKQITSLKIMDLCLDPNYYNKFNCTNLINFPEAKDCLKNLSELSCSSHFNSNFFLQLSKICYNIESLDIVVEKVISNGLKDLIFSQNNLKSLSFARYFYVDEFDSDLNDYITTSNTLTKLDFLGISSTTFITTKIIFPNLKILKFTDCHLPENGIIEFLVNNGKNLEELMLNICNDSLNLTIAKYCSNLKSLYTQFSNHGIEILKMVFINCQRLEFIITHLCEGTYLGVKDLLEIVANYSPKDFHKLELHCHWDVKLGSKDLEPFFIGWKDPYYIDFRIRSELGIRDGLELGIIQDRF